MCFRAEKTCFKRVFRCKVYVLKVIQREFLLTYREDDFDGEGKTSIETHF